MRIGVLGCAKINHPALYDPVSTHRDAIIYAVASRSLTRAKEHIRANKLGENVKAYGSYEALLADPGVDAVYVPLPNSMHCTWAIRAMEAGKHVLIEKPIANNAAEVSEIEATSQRTSKVALEAMHWNFHPAAHRVRELCRRYGPIERIDTRMGLPEGGLKDDGVRFSYEMGGGACMDLTYVFAACWLFGTVENSRGTEDGKAIREGEDKNEDNNNNDEDEADDLEEEYDFDVLEATAKLFNGDDQIDETMNASFLIKRRPLKPRNLLDPNHDHSNASAAPSPPPPHIVHCTIEASERRPLKKFLFNLLPNILDIIPPLTIDLARARIEFPNFPGPWVLCSISVTEKDEHGNLILGTKRTERAYVGGERGADSAGSGSGS